MTTSDETEIQQEIRKLVAQRDSLNDRLRSYRTNNLRSIKQKTQWTSRQPQNDSSKIAPIDSTDHSKILPNEDLKGIRSKRPLEDSKNKLIFGPDFEIGKRPKIMQDDKTQDRNRRMMSVGILNHLFSARAQLQKEENSKMAQLQREQVQKVEEKLEYGKRNLIELRKLYFEEKFTQDINQAELIQTKLVEKENELTRLHLIKHYQNMRNFIGTKCQPMIFWLPAKMNKTTEILKQDTINSIEGKIKSFDTKDFSGGIIPRFSYGIRKNDGIPDKFKSKNLAHTEYNGVKQVPVENTPSAQEFTASDQNKEDLINNLSDLPQTPIHDQTVHNITKAANMRDDPYHDDASIPKDLQAQSELIDEIPKSKSMPSNDSNSSLGQEVSNVHSIQENN